eukprot:7379632-Prymnesium_polylepis.1
MGFVRVEPQRASQSTARGQLGASVQQQRTRLHTVAGRYERGRRVRGHVSTEALAQRGAARGTRAPSRRGGARSHRRRGVSCRRLSASHVRDLGAAPPPPGDLERFRVRVLHRCRSTVSRTPNTMQSRGQNKPSTAKNASMWSGRGRERAADGDVVRRLGGGGERLDGGERLAAQRGQAARRLPVRRDEDVVERRREGLDLRRAPEARGRVVAAAWRAGAVRCA